MVPTGEIKFLVSSVEIAIGKDQAGASIRISGKKVAVIPAAHQCSGQQCRKSRMVVAQAKVSGVWSAAKRARPNQGRIYSNGHIRKVWVETWADRIA